MVRRLKSDLKRFGENFPARHVEAIVIDGLPADAPELVLANKLVAYDALLAERTRNLPPAEVARTRLVMVGLQQRLLSSIAAFTRTLEKHRDRLERQLAEVPAAEPTASLLEPVALEDEPEDEAGAEVQITKEEDEAAEAIDAGVGDKALVDEMLEIARRHANRPDARVSKLAEWIRDNMTAGGQWTDRRLILFTEYEDTRRWLERRLKETLHELDPEDRIACFTGATSTDRREELKRRFNADPATDPLRILICTDAAREGINLQARCHDLIHIDLPWNPARLEQRNGRIDRKLQPSPEVWCRYFVYRQRPEDRVLQRLIEKTETIHRQLGSAGQVLSDRIADLLARKGLRDARVTDEIDALEKDPCAAKAREEMDDREDRRIQREARELDRMRKLLEDSRKRVGVETMDLKAVVAAALDRAGASLDDARSGEIGDTQVFRLDPAAPAFGHGGWQEALDDLRVRWRGRSERLKVWRAEAPLKAIAFEPARDPNTGVDAQDVVQVHLEHRLVRRLLSHFLSQGFTSGLSRVCAIIGPGAQPRVVLIGRLALYGAGAARLHEELLMVTAAWTEPDRRTGALRPFGERGEEATLDQLEHALRENRTPSAAIVERLRAAAIRDAGDLEPELQGDIDRTSAQLAANARRAFQGSVVLGMGFTFDDAAAAKGEAESLATMHALIAKDLRNKDRIFPYIGGEEVTTSPTHAHHRYVIDFADFPLRRDLTLKSWFLNEGTEACDKRRREWLREGAVPSDYPHPVAEDWPDLLEVVRRLVKPSRDKEARKARRERWWRFGDRQPGLFRSIESLDRVLVNSSKATPHHALAFLEKGLVYSQNVNVFAVESCASFCAIQARAHEIWARFVGTTLEDRLTYVKDDCFETFPFSEGFETDPALEAAGQAYHDHRAALMIDCNAGLTKTYNRYHDAQERGADIVRLRTLHAEMDRAVLRAYASSASTEADKKAWDDLAARAEAIFLDESNEDDHTYQGRLFWPSAFRDEVLARLLALNAERHAEEVRRGIAKGLAEDEDTEEAAE